MQTSPTNRPLHSLPPKYEGLALLLKEQILKALAKHESLTLKEINRILLQRRWVSHQTLYVVKFALRDLHDEGKVRHAVSNPNRRNQYYWYLK